MNGWLENESREIALSRLLSVMGRRNVKQGPAMALREDVVKAQAGVQESEKVIVRSLGRAGREESGREWRR